MKDQCFTDGHIKQETEKYKSSRPKSSVVIHPRQWKPYVPPFEGNYGIYMKHCYNDFTTTDCCESKIERISIDTLQAMCLHVL